ncbi:MAG: hypothetical protein HPY66_3498 [Firmicutes bacterium]|nr:hypothetical protein [Bacillota bacterium]MDI6706035.1 hypothetical protein [Bacillota bacterium]
MESLQEKNHNPVLPAKPPDELIPEGYRKKVLVMWFSFFGVLFGIANMGGALGFVLPVSLIILAADLILIVFGRVKDRPVWLYKEAYEGFSRRRYDKALKKLEEIVRLRPDMEGRLLPALMVCRSRTRDIEKAQADMQKLFSGGMIGSDTSPLLLIEALCLLRIAKDWSRVIEVAGYIPQDRLYGDYYKYYMGIALAETADTEKAAEYLESIEEKYRFPDLKAYLDRDSTDQRM